MTSSATKLAYNLRRRLQEDDFDPKVFWPVNAFIAVLIITGCILCWYTNGGSCLYQPRSREESDVLFAARVAERQRRERDRRKEDPAERQARVLRSFQRNQCSMIVEEADLVQEPKHIEDKDAATDPTSVDKPRANSLGTADTMIEEIDSSSTHETDDQQIHTTRTMEGKAAAAYLEDMEAGQQGYLQLRHPSEAKQRQVPNCCAICLCDYQVGEKVVWSTTEHCPHVFHSECIIDWFKTQENSTDCPVCRQEFTDLKLFARQRLLPGSAFDHKLIRFR